MQELTLMSKFMMLKNLCLTALFYTRRPNAWMILISRCMLTKTRKTSYINAFLVKRDTWNMMLHSTSCKNVVMWMKNAISRGTCLKFIFLRPVSWPAIRLDNLKRITRLGWNRFLGSLGTMRRSRWITGSTDNKTKVTLWNLRVLESSKVEAKTSVTKSSARTTINS